MKTFKEIREALEGYVSAAQRKAVWASRADGGKGHPDNKKTKKEDAATDKAVKDFLSKGGKIKKLAPGKAAGYHGKDDPGKGMAGMMDKGDTKAIGTRKKVKSMGEAKQTHMFDNEKDARAKAKEIGGKYVKGTGKSMGKHAAVKENINELDTNTLISYRKKANKQRYSNNVTKRAQRTKGVDQADKKLTKRGVDKFDNKVGENFQVQKYTDGKKDGPPKSFGGNLKKATDHASMMRKKTGADHKVHKEDQSTGTAKIGIKTIVKGKEVPHKPTFGLKQFVKGKEVK